VALAALILAQRRGALRTLMIGAPQPRLAIAQNLGAGAVLNFRSCSRAERAEWVASQTDGRGADVVIEATGTPEAVVDGMRCARDGGTVVVVGQYTDHGETAFNPHLDLNRKHLDVRGCWGSDYSHFHRAVQILGEPELAAQWRKIPATEYRLEDVGEGLAAVAAGTVVKALVRPRAQDSRR
jgi:L-iditol 2-dehydrogenase